MMDYSQVAQHLASQASEPMQEPGVYVLPKYLTTSRGRDAARGVVDRIVAEKKMGLNDGANTHQRVLQLLINSMKGIE